MNYITNTEIINWLETIRKEGNLVSKYINEANKKEIVLVYNHEEPVYNKTNKILKLEVIIIMNENKYINYFYKEREER